MRARVWVRERAAALLLPVCTPRSFSPARLAPPPRERAHTTHCRRVSLALRISSECAVDVFAEITAAAPPDQQRFPVSCEVTGLRRELRYRPDRVSVSPPPRPGVGLPPVPSVPSGSGGKANTRISIDSWRDLPLVS